jgi:hypothetical protein
VIASTTRPAAASISSVTGSDGTSDALMRCAIILVGAAMFRDDLGRPGERRRRVRRFVSHHAQ